VDIFGRCARTKNGDVQIMCLHHRVSYYKVVQDVCLVMSLIRIYLGHTVVSPRLPLEINLRCSRVCVADLIAGWGHYGTTRRRAKGHASPITKKSGTRFNFVCRLFDALRVMYLPLQRNLGHALTSCVDDLIVGWGHGGTNRRRTISSMLCT
jgi:hypothetical protein